MTLFLTLVVMFNVFSKLIFFVSNKNKIYRKLYLILVIGNSIGKLKIVHPVEYNNVRWCFKSR